METIQCPFCGEEISADALICPHCHERVRWLREELVMNAITDRMRLVVEEASQPTFKKSVSAAEALCYYKFSRNKAKLRECLDDAKINAGIAALAEKMQKELFHSFRDIVWGGGDIDPLRDPLLAETYIRSRLSGEGRKLPPK